MNKKEENEKSKLLPIPPDGGYGWVIVVAAFVSNVIIQGIVYSYGVLLFDLMDYFGEGKAKLSIVGSLLSGVYMCIGPIVSPLVNMYGCRIITMIGSVIAAFSLAISILSQNSSTLAVAYGFFGGIGFGFVYLPTSIVVSYYFQLKRAMAAGIAACGSSVGIIVFAPLMDYLLIVYDWKGCMLILSGIVLNVTVCGALFRPIEPTPHTTEDKQENIVLDTIKPPVTERKSILVRGRSLTTSNSHDDNGPIVSNSTTRERRFTLFNPETKENIYYKPLYRKDIFYDSNVVRIGGIAEETLKDEEAQKTFKSNWIRKMSHSVLPSNVQLSDDKEVPTKSGCLSTSSNLGNIIKVLFNFSLFKKPAYVLIAVANFIAFLGYFVPNFFLMDYSTQYVSISRPKASLLLTTIGIFNCVGRVFFGWLAGLPKSSVPLILALTLMAAGSSTMMLILCTNYGMLIAYAINIGLCISALIALGPELLCQFFGLNKLSNAFGLLTLCRGTAAVIGAPIAGILYDSTKEFGPSFYVAGAFVFVGGSMHLLLLLPLFRKKQINAVRKNSECLQTFTKRLSMTANTGSASLDNV